MMIEKIFILIKYYPLFSYILMMYRCYEYMGYVSYIYNFVMYIFTPKIVDKELDEIYEMIIETEPGEYEVILDDETGYIKYDEEKKIITKYL